MKKRVFVLFLFLYNFAIIPFPRQVRSGIILSLILILISFRIRYHKKNSSVLGEAISLLFYSISDFYCFLFI